LADIPASDVDLRIGIPQRRRAESLNAAVAGSIALYEIARSIGRLADASARTNDA
jgi:tRNA G18 (ribose-2'-O)-methylase SpoU